MALIAGSTIMLTGCVSGVGANVYEVGDLNTKQETHVVQILGLADAKVKLDNSKNAEKAQKSVALAGAILGAAIGYNTKHKDNGAIAGGVGGAAAGYAVGSVVPSTVLVDAVTISYKDGTKVVSSTQVGKSCDFKVGQAIMISTSKGDTRIQANSKCVK